MPRSSANIDGERPCHRPAPASINSGVFMQATWRRLPASLAGREDTPSKPDLKEPLKPCQGRCFFRLDLGSSKLGWGATSKRPIADVRFIYQDVLVAIDKNRG